VSALGFKTFLETKMKTCVVCGDFFITARDYQTVCGLNCRKKARQIRDSTRVSVKCIQCNITFETPAKNTRSGKWIQRCLRCKVGLAHLNNRKPVNVIRHKNKSFHLPCATCEWAKRTVQTETGYLCMRSALECNPWYAARLYFFCGVEA
jgi:hypothetical protein